jgi:hypothetical protein
MYELPRIVFPPDDISSAILPGVSDRARITRDLFGAHVRAERQGRTLHNFAGFLTRVAEGRITELWMVDAKPASSDEFWS